MVLMRSGRIMQQGSPTEVFGAPANRFVADFLGYENFVQTPQGLVTVRPEHLAVSSGEATALSGLSLNGTVADVAYRGVDLLITVDAQDAQGDVTLLSDVRADGAPRVAPGDRVVVTAPSSRLVALAD
jgi:putative spermidine/putrescine transport system ATP-binding protein